VKIFAKMDFFLYMSSCSTCKRILETLQPPVELSLIDIKKNPLTESQLSILHAATGSYVSLINKRAQLFNQRGIDTKTLTEEDARALLLDHYTYLKRPVLVYRNQVFVGNSKSVVMDAKKWFDEH
jgi:arsenate reductase